MNTNGSLLAADQERPGTLVVSNGDRRAAVAAEHTGRDTTEIERLPFDLSVIDNEGLFVNVDATGFGILDRRLDWQVLGVELPKKTDVAFRPPRCGLLPNRYRRPLISPVSQAHAALHRYSYKFRLTETVFDSPAYRWVPWQAFTEFETVFNKACDNLNKAKKKVLNDYDNVCEEVINAFKQVAADSILRLSSTKAIVPHDFEDRLINWVRQALPSKDELQDKLKLGFQVGVIMLGSEMLREQRVAAEEKLRIEEAEASRRTMQIRSHAEQRVVQQELWATEESIRRKLENEEAERKAEAEVKERIRQMKMEAAREKLQETLSPLQEGAAQLRTQIYESALAMQEALKKHDFLPGATAKKARKMAKWFRLMNFQSDTVLEELLNDLEELAAKPTGKNKRRAGNAAVNAVLNDIVQLCYRDAQELAQPSRMAALEI